MQLVGGEDSDTMLPHCVETSTCRFNYSTTVAPTHVSHLHMLNVKPFQFNVGITTHLPKELNSFSPFSLPARRAQSC